MALSGNGSLKLSLGYNLNSKLWLGKYYQESPLKAVWGRLRLEKIPYGNRQDDT